MPHMPITQGRLLRDWQADGLRIVETSHTPGTSLHTHLHERPAITVVLAGGFEETVGRQAYRCGTGLLLYKPAGHAHSNSFPRRCRSLILAYQDAEHLPPGPRTLDGPAARSLGDDLRERLADGDRPAIAALAAEAAAHFRAPPGEAAPSWMRDALQLLAREFAGAIGLRRVAEAAGVHPVHLARIFRRQQGCSVGSWLRQRRVHEAMALLRHTARPLAEIALQVGFCDQAHLSHAFRREVGLTPGRYRALAG